MIPLPAVYAEMELQLSPSACRTIIVMLLQDQLRTRSAIEAKATALPHSRLALKSFTHLRVTLRNSPSVES